jgi:hypothetical protein
MNLHPDTQIPTLMLRTIMPQTRTSYMPQTLRDFARKDLEAFFKEYGAPINSRDQAVGRRMRSLAATGQIPDDILETMLEVSRHNHPQNSPQEYKCGCVAITRITDRDYLHNEEPFEMRLAIPCGRSVCELAHLRTER